MTDEPSPSPTPDVSRYESLLPADFKGSQKLEAAVRAAIGKPGKEGDVLLRDLNAVTELFLCGHMYQIDPNTVHFDADGTCRAGTGAVVWGDAKDLSIIGDMPYLKRLALIRQPVGDLSPLNGLVVLEELWLSGSTVDSVDALTDLPQLSTLHLAHTDVRDLSALSALPNLKTVTVSTEMLPILFPEDASFAVRLVR